MLAYPAMAQDARIIEWVKNAPASNPDTIALGYRVPMPVDTPLPFSGFRTYAGLHMRHQDLAATTPWVHPHEVGVTTAGRTVWAYRLGDADTTTAYGVPEQAMLSNGGIHAREWQSPEVTTGIIELLATTADDNHLISYLRDNANIIVIPVMNVDGFLQTQRYPNLSWMGTDPGFPDSSPRDGRMRRKNMHNVDEIMDTQADHLLGVDLNRNNAPYWNTSTNSSGSPDSIVHHGSGPASEPETQALDAAAQLGPAEQLSMYTDLHSFSLVHLWVRNSNNRLAVLTERLLRTFTDFHLNLPGGKWYAYQTASQVPRNDGIGSTDEYFTHTYQVPAWTLEIEPSNGQSFHAPLPGGGADYAGLGRNFHDGFILPESEVPRVRTELAQAFAVGYYQQSGPPAILAVKIFDQQTDALVYQAEWETISATGREQHVFQAQPLQLGRDYRIWMAHNKPMRWREAGVVAPMPGQPTSALDIDVIARVGENDLNGEAGNLEWIDQPGFAPNGYLRYRDDAFVVDANLPADELNPGLVDGGATVTLATALRDMVNQRTDADAATVARWSNGAWAGYEDNGGSDTDLGGSALFDMMVTDQDLGAPFVVEPGTSAAWFDVNRNGEGFVIEILANNQAVMYWFTYDSEGEQDWYIGVGDIVGNRILFAELLRISGGVFGPDFDPDAVTSTAVGSAEFAWSGCSSGVMQWKIGSESGRMNLQRLSTLMGLPCGDSIDPPFLEQARLSGSWYDPSHNGEGYTLEVLQDQRLLVYWFGFGPNGERRWFFGIGEINGNVLEFPQMLTTRGPTFGANYNPADVEELSWGSMELELSCEGGEARFTPTEPGFAAGSLDLSRLSTLDGLASC